MCIFQNGLPIHLFSQPKTLIFRYEELIHKMSIFSNNIFLPSNFMSLKDMFPELLNTAADHITE